MFSPITGRSAIVTGATRGIGKGMARVLAGAGARVLLTGRDEGAARATVAEIVSAGGQASYFLADLEDPAAPDSIVKAGLDRHGAVDILCSNAGIFPVATLAEMTAVDIDRVMNTNLRATMLIVKACIGPMQRAGKGRIIITSSITGPITGYPGWSHYGASKAAQLGFLRSAAIELAPLNITINAVMPGNVATEGLEEAGEEYRLAMEASIPLRRLGTVEDVGYAALFFASDEAGFITGQTLVIDGGQVLPESLAALDALT